MRALLDEGAPAPNDQGCVEPHGADEGGAVPFFDAGIAPVDADFEPSSRSALFTEGAPKRAKKQVASSSDQSVTSQTDKDSASQRPLKQKAVALYALVPPAGQLFPEVRSLPRDSEEGRALMLLILAAHPPVIAVADEGQQHAVIGNIDSVALARAFYPKHRHPDLKVRCVESPSGAIPMGVVAVISGIRDAMVCSRTPREKRAMSQKLKAVRGLRIVQFKPDFLTGLKKPLHGRKP